MINKGGQTLPIPVHEMAPMRTFSVLQKWPKIAKMTPNDLLTLKMVFIIFVDLERKKQIPR